MKKAVQVLLLLQLLLRLPGGVLRGQEGAAEYWEKERERERERGGGVG